MYLDLIGILLTAYYEDKLLVLDTDYKDKTIRLSNNLKYYVISDKSVNKCYVKISIMKPFVYEYIIIVTRTEFNNQIKLLLFTKAQFFSYINEYFFESKKSFWFSSKFQYTFSKKYLIERGTWLN